MKKTLKPKIVFDFDQTLGYRNGMWTITIFELLKENGYSHIDIEDIRKYIKTGFPWDFYETPHKILFKGLSWWEYQEAYFEVILRENNLEEQEAKRLSRLVRERYTDISKWCLFDETYSVLEELCGSGYDCYILSNHVPELENIVRGLGIGHFIKKVYNSAFIGYEKPNAGIYRYMIEDLDVLPSAIIMVGDNYISDIVGARSSCVNAVLVRGENVNSYRYFAKSLMEAIPIIKRIEEIRSI